MAEKRRGFVLVAMSVTLLLLLALMGLAFDVGRIYIARNEAQVYCDAAAMAAAAKLDGTEAGLDRAAEAARKLPGRWNLGTEEFHNVRVEFDAKEAANVTTVRVTAPDNSVEILLLRAVGGPASFTVPAHAAASARPVRLVE